MSFEILSVYENLDAYIKELERPDADIQALWDQYAIAPYWQKLCEYAPMDISDRKPKPPADTGTLKKQIELLRHLDLGKLKAVFEDIASLLPGDDSTMYIALYPIQNDWVRKAQNGVLGTCTWGNIIISIDPLADDYAQWIPYVFAHEYHHNIWGYHWYNLHRGELEDIFLNSMLSDGLADSFALSFFPDLKPKWLYDISGETEKKLWNVHYSLIIKETDVDYHKYMFGNDIEGIPWCAGYAIGFRIVQHYIKKHPQTSMKHLLEMRPIDVFSESGYSILMAH